MADDIQYPQFSAEGLPITYVPDPFKADGQPVSSQWKEPVRTLTNGDITLAGLQTISGVSLMEGDRVLVKDQVNAEENGIWVASATAWQRARDMYLWPQFVAAVVAVEEGFAPSEQVWATDVPSSGTVDTTPVNWIKVTFVTGTIPTFTPLRALITDAAGAPSASPTTSQEIAFVSGVTSAIQPQFAALDNKASSAFSIAVAGTNAAALAQSAANTAQSTANSAFNIAVIGTNVGTAAYNAALSAQSTANSAFSIAVIGTNAAATAQSTASSAYTLAQAGTNIGSLAYTVATALGDKYVRTTRFASIGAGTSGAVTLPANATVVLDDFGGGVDAVVTTIVAARPTFSHAFTLAGAIVTTSFDAGGNYTFSGAPSAYPVALIYRVRQKLSEFDSTSTDIIGDYDVEGINSVQGTADQVYVNGSLGVQYGNLVLTTPPAWALAQIGTNTGTAAYNLAQSGSNVASAAYALAVAGTVIPPLSTLPDVSIPAPYAGQNLVYNGTLWVSEYPQAEISHAGFTYYLDGTDTAHPGYELLTTVPLGGTEVTETATGVTSAGSVLIDQYLSGTFGRTMLDAGIWEYNTYASATAPRSTIQVRTLVLSGTTEIPLWSGSTDELPSTVSLVPFEVFGTAVAVNATDRLLVRYYGAHTGGGSANVTLYHNGSLHYTHIHTPLSALHNQLAGLQGGNSATSEFYHLTASQYSQLGVAVSTITSGTTIVSASPAKRVYLADATAGAIVVALPNTLGWSGQTVTVKKISTGVNTVTVRSATGTQTIDGQIEQTFSASYVAMQVTTDGLNWYII